MTKRTNIITDKTWRKALLKENATIKDAVQNLQESGMQISLVASKEGILLGTVTDGDIRRGLLEGLSLSSSIESVIHHKPMVVPPEFGHDLVLQLMHTNKIHQLPVVDEDNQIVGLHVLDNLMLPKQRDNIIVIMAGGKGTRLSPYTKDCPKPLLPIAGKPILQHIIERARSEGFHHFVLAIHYLGQMIEDYFGDGDSLGVKIEYLKEELPLGTAGAIGLMDPRPNAPFLVSNGDVLTHISYGDLLDYHSNHNAAATMVVRLHEWQHPFGIVHTDGIDITGFEEKPVSLNNVNAGIYVLEPSIIDFLSKENKCDMPSLFYKLQEHDARTIVYPLHESWLDIGQPEDYISANNDG